MPKAGELLLNGVKNGRPYVLSPMLRAGDLSYFEGDAKTDMDKEAATFRDAILGKGKLCVLPEQALVVTRILEGIYDSAASGKPYYFNEE